MPQWHDEWYRFRELPTLDDDVRFLRGLLTGGEPEIQKAMLHAYWKQWRLAAQREPMLHKQDNAGRRVANRWIRMEVDRLRHQEPEAVRQYREAVRTPLPKCCHTCEYYMEDGICDKFGEQPPEDFAATPDLCPEYEQEVPF